MIAKMIKVYYNTRNSNVLKRGNLDENMPYYISLSQAKLTFYSCNME